MTDTWTDEIVAQIALDVTRYNFRRLLEWLVLLLSIILAALTAPADQKTPITAA